jgi:hypothetical protein
VRRAAALLLLGTSIVLGRPAAAASSACAGINAEALLIRARAVFRTRALPPYIVYTLDRRDTIDGMYDPSDTYTTRVWYRTADGTALTRRVYNGRAKGALVFERPRFDAALDPGPPTADIFEPAAPQNEPHAQGGAQSNLPTIAIVRAPVEADYRAEAVDCTLTAVHLVLTPRRDPDRNRLRELWVDSTSARVMRFIANDRLYDGMTDLWVPDVFDVAFAAGGDIALVETIHARAETLGGAISESSYRFEDVAFPVSLPDWYFQPSRYGAHARDAPE